jgi:hypothetical protein
MALQRLLRPAELHATKAAAVPVEEVKHSFDTGAHYSLAAPPPPRAPRRTIFWLLLPLLYYFNFFYVF